MNHSKIRCTHDPTRKIKCQIIKKNNQNWINIYVLPFKAMEIMTSFFFIRMNVKKFKPTIHLMKF